MENADGDARERSGMGGRREGVMDRSGADDFFHVASVGEPSQGRGCSCFINK